uniref:Uncharacterized AAA domain-containing protein ycf46 n=1 Tax=Candidatus Kentrum sp. FM TaxID=2126340 RepID=A0A450RW12_9GAMM|nr:MAG: TIR domain-containing protein [Candidatus Kentron sp. FM]VFJ43324.1 MAG: TIR domain-containing protein [Candidatus Kentron sp. FM]VFK05489.1 MAG: TIR domain-containing protein [Candidatus Kentron sp. FM]
MSQGIEVFICYAHEDVEHKNALVKHLAPLEHNGLIHNWHDGQIEPGTDWQSEIMDALERCHLALLLISPDFLHSEFIYSEELRRLFERRQNANIRIIPIIVRASSWDQDKHIKRLQPLPKDLNPIALYKNVEQDQVWTTIVKYLAGYAKKILPLVLEPPPKQRLLTNIGPYRIEGKLGESPYRTLYKASTQEGLSVALAIPHDQRGSVSGNQRSTFRELKEHLQHPGLVPILDADIQDDLFFVAYGFVEGKLLTEQLQRREINEGLQLIEKIGKILQWAHSQGIFHCELSPREILIGSDGRIELLDMGRFGVLQRCGLSYILKTEAEPYRSPEQWATSVSRNEASADVWALGIIAYQLFTGHHPFEHAVTQEDWRAAIVEETAQSALMYQGNLPKPISNVLERALAKSPKDRYQSVPELVAALQRAEKNISRIGGFEPDLELALEAGSTVCFVETEDETETVSRLEKIAKRAGYDFFLWGLVSGLTCGLHDISSQGYQMDPLGVLNWLAQCDHPTLLTLLDYDAYLDEMSLTTDLYEPFREMSAASTDPDNAWPARAELAYYLPWGDEMDRPRPAYPKEVLNQRIKELATQLRHPGGHRLIIAAPGIVLPTELTKVIQHHVALPPGRRDIEELIQEVAGDLPDWADEYVRHALGLSTSAIRDSLRLSVVRYGKLEREALHDLFREKEQIVRKDGLLELIHPSTTFDQNVVGLGHLRSWCAARSRLLNNPLLAAIFPSPKGLLLGGMPGCGKTLSAQAIAGEFGWPLLRLSFERLFTAELGKAEANMQEALLLAELLSPTVLWIDDIDKGFGDASGGSGLRMLQGFLNWLQERNALVFLVITATNPESLPVELTRAGRIEAVFFLDWPHQDERATLLAHTLERYGRDPSIHDLQALSDQTEGCSSAELVGRVESALFVAADNGRIDPTPAELEFEITELPCRSSLDDSLRRIRSKWQNVGFLASSPKGEHNDTSQ